uniref:Magnesium transporter n=1 Tax=Panagrellus redivivus TaxID=6233 RepID=A0A7E4VFT4_PANRE
MTTVTPNLPETVMIRTLDNQVMEVTGKLIDESQVANWMYETHRNTGATGAMFLPVQSAHLRHALEALALCDLDTPHVLFDRDEREAFTQANQPVMDYFHSQPNEAMVGIHSVMDVLSMPRLGDLWIVYFLDLTHQISPEELRELIIMYNLTFDFAPQFAAGTADAA